MAMESMSLQYDRGTELEKVSKRGSIAITGTSGRFCPNAAGSESKHFIPISLLVFLGSMLPQYTALFVSFSSFVRFVKKKFRPLLSKLGG